MIEEKAFHMNNLRRLRRERGIPMLGLAVLARVSTATLGQIERWNYTPSSDVCERVARALGVPVSAIWPSEAGQVGQA
jgi:DNA-binding XRE family transcriptional regulator